MRSNDKFSEEFNNLLNVISSELDNQKKINSTNDISNDVQEDTKNSSENTEEFPEEDTMDNGGTRVFDAVKPEQTPGPVSYQGSENDFGITFDDIENPTYQPQATPPPELQPNLPYQEYNIENIDIEKTDNSLTSKKTNDDNMSSKRNKTVKRKKRKKKYGLLGSFIKFVAYVAFVLIVSVFLAKYIIGVGNDMFSFTKDTYSLNFNEIKYTTIGETGNSFEVTDNKINGDMFSFSYKFKNELSSREINSLNARIEIIKAEDNTVVHDYGKYRNEILSGEPITINLSKIDMSDGNYLIRLTIDTENELTYITEIPLKKNFVTINVAKDASTKEIAEELKEKGIIEHPFAFEMYVKLKNSRSNASSVNYLEGNHNLYVGMDYGDIINAISKRVAERKIIKLTFPEGSTVDEIIEILMNGDKDEGEGGITSNSKNDYLEVINDYQNHKDDYSFDYKFIELLDSQEISSERPYRLEGYLFPDTYEFYSDENAFNVIYKFLANFNKKFEKSFYDRAEQLGLTVDEVLRIASLVEMEAGVADDMYNISSVFHNRIKNGAAQGIYGLQSDATKDYKCYEMNERFSIQEDARTGKITVNLANYSLENGDYYLELILKTAVGSQTVKINVNKETTDTGEIKYSSSENNISISNAQNDLKISVSDLTVKGSVISCVLQFEHAYDATEFRQLNRSLNLYRKAYNTYETTDMIPGPISNPGYAALYAALYPAETNYYYFVADKSGKSHFASTLDEHNQNINKIRNEGIIEIPETVSE